MNVFPADELETRNRLRSIVNRTTELRPLRSVALRAIAMAQDERTAAMDLAAVISSDQALTAKLLRLSNSPYYGYARRISNVREAVILLGMRTVRSVAVSSAIIEAMEAPGDPPGFDSDLFWAHSVCVGLVAETLARDTRVARPEDAFTAGVLHDIGKLALVICEPALFAAVVDYVVREGMPYHEAERRIAGVSHALIGGRLAMRWKFPEPLVEAIRNHHQHSGLQRLDTLADIVAAADLACNKAGLAAGFDWTNEPSRHPVLALSPRVESSLGRANGGLHGIEERARAFLLHVTARRPRWYASIADDAPDLDHEQSQAVA